jgi:hypothetical protein
MGEGNAKTFVLFSLSPRERVRVRGLSTSTLSSILFIFSS